MNVRPLREADRPWLRDIAARTWGLPVVSISGTYDPSSLPGWVVEDGVDRIGVLTYRLAQGECEVVTLNSFARRQGVGTALLACAKALADRKGCRLWLITTNENIDAIRFYQRRGMDMTALHRDFAAEVRRHKPFLDASAGADIAFRHAIEFSY